MKILITGSSGLLGAHLLKYLTQMGLNAIGLSKSGKNGIAVDLLDCNQLHETLDFIRPNVIVNLAALTNVDLCEKDPVRCFDLNVKAVDHLTAWIKNRNYARLIHISSDQLYDGNLIHREINISPSNYYSYSKYCSELLVENINGISLRTNFFGKSYTVDRSSFSDYAIDLVKNNKSAKLFEDVYFSPLHITTLVEAIRIVAFSNISGVYNLGSKDGISKKEFVLKIAELFNINYNNFQSISVDECNLIAKRPKNMVMNSEKFENAFNFKIPNIIDEINKLKDEYYEI